MIETNDISEEKIKMKQTMEGMKFCCFFWEHPVLGTLVPALPLTFCSCRGSCVEGPLGAVSDFASWHLLSGFFFF